MAGKKGGKQPPKQRPSRAKKPPRASPQTKAEKWNAAAWFNDHYSLMRMSDSRGKTAAQHDADQRLQIATLDFWKREGNGAIELLARLAKADREGPQAFEEEAERIAAEFDKDLREVYTLWKSPQLEVGYDAAG